MCWSKGLTNLVKSAPQPTEATQKKTARTVYVASMLPAVVPRILRQLVVLSVWRRQTRGLIEAANHFQPQTYSLSRMN